MHDVRWIPIVAAAGGELMFCPLPDAPVIADNPRRESPGLRGFGERLARVWPRLSTTRPEKEEACGT